MIKLTAKDFDIHKCTEKESYCFISQMNPDQVLDQIFENQEKAEKWDSLLASAPRTIVDNISMVHEENKRLKEKIEKVNKWRIEYDYECHDCFRGAELRELAHIMTSVEGESHHG